MRRDEAIEILRQHAQDLERFHVRSVSLFGSVARDTARANSDVDILVEFQERVTFDRKSNYRQLALYFESLLGRRVDLIELKFLDDGMWDEVMSDIFRVY